MFGGFGERDVDEFMPKLAYGPEAAFARSQMRGLSMMRFDAPDQTVAGMSDIEQSANERLKQFVQRGDMRDPRSDPFFRGLRQESREEEGRAVALANRSANAAGMFRSGDARVNAGRIRSGFASQRLQVLGQLFGKERERNSLVNRARAGLELGGLGRNISDRQSEVGVNNAMRRLGYESGNRFNMLNTLLQFNPRFAPQLVQQQSGLDQLGQATKIGQGMVGGDTSVFG